MSLFELVLDSQRNPPFHVVECVAAFVDGRSNQMQEHVFECPSVDGTPAESGQSGSNEPLESGSFHGLLFEVVVDKRHGTVQVRARAHK
jgi:hypothetical protein